MSLLAAEAFSLKRLSSGLHSHQHLHSSWPCTWDATSRPEGILGSIKGCFQIVAAVSPYFGEEIAAAIVPERLRVNRERV